MLKSLALGFPGYQERRVSHDGAISGNIEGGGSYDYYRLLAS